MTDGKGQDPQGKNNADVSDLNKLKKRLMNADTFRGSCCFGVFSKTPP
jgi:hypothetical protein